jgi:type I restriction enzyme S subunit
MPALDEHTGAITSAVDRILNDVWSGYTHFADGDVVFAKITPCMENGKAAVAKGLTNSLACGSTEFYVLRAEGVSIPEYLWRFLRQKSFRGDAKNQMSGAVGQQRVPKQYLEEHRFPLPPLAEQRRIVAKLDVLTARLARARAEIDRISVLSKKIRDSVFFQEFPVSRDRKLILGEALEDIRYGTSKRCDYGEGVPVLRIPNIQSGRIKKGDLKFADFEQDEIAKLSLRGGDVLVIRSNGSRDLVGKSAVVGEDAAGMLYAGYLIRLRLDQSKLLPDYLHAYLSSPSARQIIEALARSTSGVNNINAEQLKALTVPAPSLDAQRSAVSAINLAMTHADRLEAEAARARALLDRLEAAILAKAFRGELVPQDPNDEPASVLLDRIRAQRAAAPQAKRSRQAVA